jgi:hypothetical protein
MNFSVVRALLVALPIIGCSGSPSAKTTTLDARKACEGVTLTPVNGTTPPVLISQAKPDPRPFAPYATALICAEIQVEVDGSVTWIRTVSSTNPEYTNVFRKAVLRWRYKPAELDGQPVAFRVLVSSSFQHF